MCLDYLTYYKPFIAKSNEGEHVRYNVLVSASNLAEWYMEFEIMFSPHVNKLALNSTQNSWTQKKKSQPTADSIYVLSLIHI